MLASPDTFHNQGTNMAKPTEKDLDRAIEDAFKTTPGFVDWFLAQTKFKDEGATYCWSRSNHPWGKVDLTVPNPHTGESERISREGETDVLVVFETASKKKVALHIENKLTAGKFTLWQPELYAARAASWKGHPSYGEYEEWETILVAPTAFFDRNELDARKFDRFIPHEEIAVHVPVFGTQV